MLPQVSLAAEPPADFEISGGHFFGQTSPSGGYSVTDLEGLPFWTWFTQIGGAPVAGYPVSRRFAMDGLPAQAFQKLVLQWQGNRFGFMNVFDQLAAAGKDEWLARTKQVPTSRDWKEDTGDSWPSVQARHLAILELDDSIRAAYRSVEDPMAMFGLPMAAQDYENVFVVRAQRAVFQKWKVNLPWARAGEVTVANGGEIAREAGLFSTEAVTPEPDPRLPAAAPAPVVAAPPPAPGSQSTSVSPAARPTATAVAAPTQTDLAAANRDAIAEINRLRGLAGVPPLALDPAIARAAQAHANWLSAVGAPSGNPFTHDEWPGSPLYTGARPEDRMAAAGYTGCCAAEYTWGYLGHVTPVEAVDGWMGGTIHRTFLIHPGVTKAGFGIRKDVNPIAVLDLALESWTGRQETIVYPVPNQLDVPAVTEGAEDPSPIPGRVDGFAYPVTVIPFPGWPSAQAIVLSAASLKNSKGVEIPFVTQFQRTYAVHLVGTEPLRSFETYTVHVEGTGSTGIAFNLTWSFTTGRATYGGKPID